MGKQRWHWMSAAVFLIGVFSIGLLLWVNRLSDRQQMNSLLVSAFMDAQINVATGHLWLEEALGGDSTAKEALDEIDQATYLVDSALKGGKTEHGPILLPLKDAALRARLDELKQLIMKFRVLAQERLRNTAIAGVGSAYDQQFDALFKDILTKASALEGAVEASNTRDRLRSGRIFLGVLSAWAFIVIAATAGLWSREKRRRSAEEALMNAHEQLLAQAEELTTHRERLAEMVAIRTAELTAANGLLRDEINERKRAEGEREMLSEERATLEEQLRQAQKIEAIGRLAGGVAHDFNNLTAIILGYGEMLLGQLRPGEPGRAWAEQIVAAGKRSAALTGQLLAFSRKQTLLLEVLDLNFLLRNLDGMLGRLIGEDIRRELRLAPELGRITADPGQIEQVVTNLVINARDAMPQGGRLTFETADVELDEAFAREHASVVPGKYVMLALTDTGCGMDKATLAKLFEPFFTTKDRGKGTGLGLATAFGVVKQSGGYIYVSSEPGQGTTFTIYLPWTDAKPKADPVENAGGAPQRGSGERILLVEDEASLREWCATVLSRLGYRVATAGSGAEALLLAEEQGLAPDLLLTDVVMPGMSGPEIAERLWKDRPGLKVLNMSGYPDGAVASHGVLNPGTSFLQKPFSERALAAKVREALGPKAGVARPARRVLMIDDDRQFIDLMGHCFSKTAHVFAGVDSTAAALEALAGQPFDVLLVDLHIPGTSGERILREIRAAGHAAPVIVMTGDLASADMALLRPLGVVLALEKSSNAEPLLQAIEEAAEIG